ncbi:MAG: TIM-barrel domain-containing protein, partial [Bacteroidota bacterium]
MHKKYFFLIAFLFAVTITTAQNKNFKTSNGAWSVVPYASNVVKLTFKPNGYTRNENITNAVFAKPLLKPAVIKISSNDSVILLEKGRRVKITAAAFSDGYNGFKIELNGDEKIFGGGERALPLNRRGYKFPLYNNPWYGYSNGADALNFSVPFFTSSDGYALFFDNASKGYVDIGKTDSSVFEAGFSSGELNVYVIFGKDYKEILSSYFKLTGTQPLPPRWAMGNFMSRFGYGSEAEVKDIAGKMKKEQIPFDAIIFDLFWFGDSIKRTMGNLDWVNKTAWPNPKKMIGDFKKQNINTVLIAEPFILENTKQYNFAKKYFAVDIAGKPFRLTDFYFGYGGLLDIFRKDAGDWIWNNHYKEQIANGVTAWWTDLGEPEKHPASLMHNLKSLGVKRLMGADEVHNIYGHYWNKMLFDNYAKELPNERLFHLNRSGFAGSQRYNIFPWSGDVSRSWSGLQAQVPLMLGMSMSGIPYIHADAGGFAGGEGDNELYVRWLQYAAFTPIFRPHGTALFEKDTATFSFPSE